MLCSLGPSQQRQHIRWPIWPAELEQTISAMPGVREVVVFGVPDDRWGETPLAEVLIQARRGQSPPDGRTQGWPVSAGLSGEGLTALARRGSSWPATSASGV
jgi:hypothetical protein